jgi:hypothetical protein
MQRLAIVCERPQHPSRLSRPDNRDEIGRQQSGVHEHAQRPPRIVHTFDGESEIVHDEHNRPAHLLAREWRRRHRRRHRCGRFRNRYRPGGPAFRRSDRRDGYELRERDLLPLAVLEDVEIRRRQAANDFSLPIGDNRVDRHDVHRDAEPVKLRGRLACAGRRRRAARNDDDRRSFCGAPHGHY